MKFLVEVLNDRLMTADVLASILANYGIKARVAALPMLEGATLPGTGAGE